MANVLRTPKSKDRLGDSLAEEPSAFNLSRMVSADQRRFFFKGRNEE